MNTPQTSASDLASRIERLEAIEAIRQLKARYLNACDTQDPQAVSNCFADSGVVIDMGHLGVFHSGDEFAAFYWAAGCHDYVFDLHQGANPEIDILDESHARGVWSLNYRNINTRERTITFLSLLYHDEYTKVSGKWKIVKCRVEFRTAMHLTYASGALVPLLAGRSLAHQAAEPHKE